jgi:hypothetical protein
VARRHAKPGGQRAAPVVFGDLRPAVCVADEKPHAHGLHDIGSGRPIRRYGVRALGGAALGVDAVDACEHVVPGLAIEAAMQ